MNISRSKGYLNFEAKAGGEVRIFGFYQKQKKEEKERKKGGLHEWEAP